MLTYMKAKLVSKVRPYPGSNPLPQDDEADALLIQPQGLAAIKSTFCPSHFFGKRDELLCKVLGMKPI